MYAIMCFMYVIQKSDMHIYQLWLGLWVRIKQLTFTIVVCLSANGFYQAERYILYDIQQCDFTKINKSTEHLSSLPRYY